ncbi:MAG: asparagine synthase (glutamine-hydrolyzing) [Acidobacteriota bacterium]
MCGIAGILRFEPGRGIAPELLDRMTDVLAHRGPDGRGVFLDGTIGLGHRRLSIIDLSPDGTQPLANEDRSVWVTFNGEIYNFRDLRVELIGKGHTFRSHTDTEVLVHLYEEMGSAMVDRLRGMFAFAVWDARKRRLIMARDRFGQKPLYYRLDDRSLYFASEIKGILQDPEVPREPDPEALHSYLTYGYTPAPTTAFAGIRKLPPGHLMTVEADGRHNLRRYWRLEMAPKDVEPTAAERARAADRVLELLDEATALRMISDVPLGAFLSGGVDSSAVVASMCIHRAGGDGPPRTFCIGFDEKGFDESPFAERVARHLATDHRTLELTEDSLAGLERIAWHYGEPYADSSCLPTFALSKLARQHVTVALTGDGGDEQFVGYRRYLATQREEGLRSGPALWRSLARNRFVIELLRRGRRKALANEFQHNRRYAALSDADLYTSRVELARPELKAVLYTPEHWQRTRHWDARDLLRRTIAASDGSTLTERCAHADVTTYLPDDILVKVDVASMAHGLECRAPLLDHVLAEHVARLPFRFKLDGDRRKAILKDALRHRLPAEIIDRRKKGFGIPLKRWFQGTSGDSLRETLLSQRAIERGLFDPGGIEHLIEQHSAGIVNRQAPLFSLLMLEHWHRLWIDSPPTLNAP